MVIQPEILRRLSTVVAFAWILFHSPGLQAQSAAQAATSPFATLSGSWSGAGTITMANGTSERIRCRAAYSVEAGGRKLVQDLRCASDSYKFELKSNVDYDGGSLSGVWSETIRNAAGNVSGRASGSHINARVEGAAFNANLAVTTRGDRQSVVIRPIGSEFTEVSITLKKS